MSLATGLFDTEAEAADAVRALKDAGISDEDISLIANITDRQIDHETALADDAGAAPASGPCSGAPAGCWRGWAC
jgi:hypothetical protein